MAAPSSSLPNRRQARRSGRSRSPEQVITFGRNGRSRSPEYARLLGCSDPVLRRSGRELEETGLVLRHMDEANHPAAGRRFDLRPLAARHAEISARIAEIFAAHQRARAARRFCRTASDPASQPEEPVVKPAPADTSPQGPSDPPGGEVKSDAPIDTDTDPDAHSERVQSQQTEAVDNSSDAS